MVVVEAICGGSIAVETTKPAVFGVETEVENVCETVIGDLSKHFDSSVFG